MNNHGVSPRPTARPVAWCSASPAVLVSAGWAAQIQSESSRSPHGRGEDWWAARRTTTSATEPGLPAATPLAPEGLRRDATAIHNALELPWTTSPVEGQVNRIKTLKRAMYGRAGFDLLRRRVLLAA